jgi:hypothetical protein
MAVVQRVNKNLGLGLVGGGWGEEGGMETDDNF